jgi:hypothetical protein
MCNGPTNALFCNKTLIQMSQTKTLKITPTCFDDDYDDHHHHHRHHHHHHNQEAC